MHKTRRDVIENRLKTWKQANSINKEMFFIAESQHKLFEKGAV